MKTHSTSVINNNITYMNRICKNCIVCGVEKKATTTRFCKKCRKENELKVKSKKLDETIEKQNKKIEVCLFVEEMMYRKRFFFDIVDIFRMIDYWLIIKNRKHYENSNIESQLESYWKDLIFFYSYMRKNENFKGYVKNDIFK
jgi:hypothetical protein